MSELYPLLLKPQFVERIWGSRDLSPLFGPAPGEAPIGEVWLTGDDCRVANGALAGASLGELCRKFGRDLVGETAPEAERFPLLVKFLFPQDKLSVQVHPDDETARRSGLLCGKTECWYVLKADPGAKIGLGLKPGTTREQFARAIEEVRAEELLNWIEVRPSEMIYVDAGTVHAIGPGVVLVETQQNSDTTYRLYDYGRPRELHVQQGLAALKEKTEAGKVQGNAEANQYWAELVRSACFVVQKFAIQDGKQVDIYARNITSKSAACVLIAVDGCGVVESESMPAVTLSCGDAVVIPASLRNRYAVRGQWNVTLLHARVPAGNAKEPETYLYPPKDSEPNAPGGLARRSPAGPSPRNLASRSRFGDEDEKA